jgi:hypothetical protein
MWVFFFHCLVFKLVRNDILDVYSGNGSLGRIRVMMFNATFNNISVISWLSVVLPYDHDHDDPF